MAILGLIHPSHGQATVQILALLPQMPATNDTMPLAVGITTANNHLAFHNVLHDNN